MNAEPRTLNPEPSALRVWFLAARPKTLWAAVAPVLIGTGLAYTDGLIHVPTAIAALGGALLIQIGTNYCNDYADYTKGADTASRTGPARATQSGWVAPEAMQRATVLVFSLAALVGIYLVLRGGWPMFWIGVLAIAAGVAYTAGPYPLAYLGLGEIVVLIFFGPIAVGGTYYVQTLEWPLHVTIAGMAPGLLSCALLVVNNLRDADEDQVVGKRTLAVRFGKPFARVEYGVCVLSAIVLVPGILWRYLGQTPDLMLAGLSVVGLVKPLQSVAHGAKGAELNAVLGETARLLLLYALLFTLGGIAGILQP